MERYQWQDFENAEEEGRNKLDKWENFEQKLTGHLLHTMDSAILINLGDDRCSTEFVLFVQLIGNNEQIVLGGWEAKREND